MPHGAGKNDDCPYGRENQGAIFLAEAHPAARRTGQSKARRGYPCVVLGTARPYALQLPAERLRRVRGAAIEMHSSSQRRDDGEVREMQPGSNRNMAPRGQMP